MIYTSENDNLLLRKHFRSDEFGKDNPLLLSIRSLLLGFKITKNEADVIQSTFSQKDVREAFRRKFFNVLSVDVPLGKEADFWFGSDIEIRGKQPDEIKQVIGSKALVLEMLEKAMKILINPISEKSLADGKRVDLSFDANEKDDPYQVKFLARNKYIGTVVNCLVQIKLVADATKDETKEQTQARLAQNSTK